MFTHCTDVAVWRRNHSILHANFQLLYALLTGLASWGLSDTTANGDLSHFNSCEMEAQGKIRAGKDTSIIAVLHPHS
uniref:Uncharacterized protein n=1 Tax=Parascaris equorum TaxID=6256 RepID=A0A914RM25_PAREQ